MHRGIELCLSATLWSFATLFAGAPASAAPQIPDVYVYDVGVNGGDTNDFAYYGQSGGIAAYSFASQSCNRGTAPVEWTSARHPVIGQNLFRLKDGRFEQLGYSWLKHGFCAVDENEGAPCTCTGPDGNCNWLAIGCADTYWATLNDGGSGRSKRWVNATSGAHVETGPSPSGVATIRGRVQVAVTDIDPAQNPGAAYFAEVQYVTLDDHQAGASDNNASYRKLNVTAVNNIDGGGGTIRGFPAIYAWKAEDRSVALTWVTNNETDGQSKFLLAHKVSSVGPGVWHYEYALQNFTSDQSAASFSVPVDAGVNLTNVGFHDVNSHSGDPWDSTDWTATETATELEWATTPFATNPNANALRWGTLYNFRFDANVAPTIGSVTLGLFKPGPNSEIVVDTVSVPSAPLTFDKKIRGESPASGGDTTIPLTFERNGSFVNEMLLESSPALVGEEWRAQVQLPGVSETILLVGLGGPTEGTMTKVGEILIRPPLLSTRGSSAHELKIPADPALVGFEFSTQALALTDHGWRLTNALDITVGSAD